MWLDPVRRGSVTVAGQISLRPCWRRAWAPTPPVHPCLVQRPRGLCWLIGLWQRSALIGRWRCIEACNATVKVDRQRRVVEARLEWAQRLSFAERLRDAPRRTWQSRCFVFRRPWQRVARPHGARAKEM